MQSFIYFLAVFLASIFSFRWVYRAARASAGVGFEEELRYHRSVRHQPKASKHVARWLVRKSDTPQKNKTSFESLYAGGHTRCHVHGILPGTVAEDCD